MNSLMTAVDYLMLSDDYGITIWRLTDDNLKTNDNNVMPKYQIIVD